MRKRNDRLFRPILERLEVREVPAGITTDLRTGVLTVIGTGGHDQINVSQSATQVTVRGSSNQGGVITNVTRSYALSNVNLIVVTAEGGNDTIIVDGNRQTRLFGGWGDDTIYGANINDSIWGGDGNDRLFGRSGNDTLIGGAGTDTLNGGTGTNNFYQNAYVRSYQASSIEAEVVRLVNIERTSRGLAPLSINAQLGNAAKLHSSNMATKSHSIGLNAAMQHTLFGTITPTVASRLEYSGYSNYTAWGENIAYGYTTAQEVVTAWMNSPGHRANILSANFTEIGVGMVTNAQGVMYWTQEFGRR
jgi:uncharacterized protein YkwD